jgi:hypothetical protein
MVQPSATRCSCIAILWVSLVSFDAITLRVASQIIIRKGSLYFLWTGSGNFWTRRHKTTILSYILIEIHIFELRSTSSKVIKCEFYGSNVSRNKYYLKRFCSLHIHLGWGDYAATIK